VSLTTISRPTDAQDREPPRGPRHAAPRRRRVVAGRVATALAFLLVYLALVIPNQVGQLTPGAMVRIPFEAIVGVLLVLVMPTRAQRTVAATAGALLGLLTILRILDMAFATVLARGFDPVFDWSALASAVTFLTDSIGRVAAIAVAAGVAILAVALVVGMMLAVLRLTGLITRHRAVSTRALPLVAVAWGMCFTLGAQIVAPVPVASWGVTSLAVRTASQVSTTLRNHQEFAAQQAAADPFASAPPAELLTALRGKDVMLTFVESYGRSAIEHPEIAPQVDAVLDAGTRRLEAAGYSARSAFLTSSTAGGGSWLAHATLQSGLWVTNQHDYLSLTGSDRLTLSGAFQRADWRTVGVMPGVTSAWPEAAFYGIDKVHDSNNLGYRGESFTGFYTPDQYTLSAFERMEHGPDHPPLMAEIPLTSSHWPWAPIPQLVDWSAVGDGTVYNSMADDGDPLEVVWSDPSRVRAAYAESIEYSLNSLISYVETYGDDDLVLVFLGDHQPAPVVTGENAGRDVPITVVARDPAVLDRIAGWNWESGLNPGPQAPVWRMDAFRDQFLTAFAARGVSG
jgi:hypothetical protein